MRWSCGGEFFKGFAVALKGMGFLDRLRARIFDSFG